MASKIINSILVRIDQPDLLKILSEELSGTELNSLLLEVLKHRTQSLTAPELLNLYQGNRFVKAADLPVLEMKETELDVLRLFEQHSFKAEYRLTVSEKTSNEVGYYKGIQFKVDISYRGKTHETADGGFVDWTQQLLQNKKERLLTSGFGFDLMYRILNNEL